MTDAHRAGRAPKLKQTGALLCTLGISGTRFLQGLEPMKIMYKKGTYGRVYTISFVQSSIRRNKPVIKGSENSGGN